MESFPILKLLEEVRQEGELVDDDEYYGYIISVDLYHRIEAAIGPLPSDPP